MNIAERLRLLYQPDRRMGDSLLKPIRWCERHWQVLAQQIDIRNPCQLLIACAKVALLIVPTLVAAIFAMIGMVLKAFSSPSPSISTRPMGSISTRPMPREEIYVNLRNQVSETTLPFSPLYKDLFIYVATFLPRTDQLALAGSARKCYQNIDSLVLWKARLTSARMWGATREEFNYDPKQRRWISNLEGWEEISPLTQLRTHYRLNLDSFLDYIARLMPGGPIAFSRISQLTHIVNASVLSPVEMSTSLARGVDSLGTNFLALKLLDKSAPSVSSQKVLVFRNVNGVWTAEWEYGKLVGLAQNTLNYILALIRREDLALREEFSFLPYKTSVELSNNESLE